MRPSLIRDDRQTMREETNKKMLGISTRWVHLNTSKVVPDPHCKYMNAVNNRRNEQKKNNMNNVY